MHRGVGMVESEIAYMIGSQPFLAKPLMGTFNCGEICGAALRRNHKSYGFYPVYFYHYTSTNLLHLFHGDFTSPMEWSYFAFLPAIDSVGFPA